MSNSVSTLWKSQNSSWDNTQDKASESLGEDSQIWHDLKQAITISSGFHRWKQERAIDDQLHLNMNLDQQVRSYLRETLETLAY